MPGGNHPNSSSSSSSHRKTRWESNSSAPPPTTTKSPSDPKSIPNSNNPNPNSNPNPNPSPKFPPNHPALLAFHFPEPGPPPPPSYGFHMLDRRTIVLADGSVRSYFALPPDYQNFTPPPHPIDHMRYPPPRFDPPRFDGRLPDYPNPMEAASLAKRKYGEDVRDEFARQREQLLRNANGYGNRVPGGEFPAGSSGPVMRDMMGNVDLRPSKHSRVDGVVAGSSNNARHLQIDQDTLKKTFVHFIRVINDNPLLKKTYLDDGKQGRLPCVACGSVITRPAKDFSDLHALIMHTYNSDNADLRADHLGLHKALCVLMGWNHSKTPDNSKAYQFLSADEVDQEDLIMWPPLVIIHNTNTGKSRDGRMEGLGNKWMDSKIRELGFFGCKSKALYGKEGHLGVTLIKFAGDKSGFAEAMRLAEHFKKENHGRKGWALVQAQTVGKDDENNPNLVKVDEKKGEKNRILYGHLGTAFDLDKVDFDTRKKVALESRREH